MAVAKEYPFNQADVETIAALFDVTWRRHAASEGVYREAGVWLKKTRGERMLVEYAIMCSGQDLMRGGETNEAIAVVQIVALPGKRERVRASLSVLEDDDFEPLMSGEQFVQPFDTVCEEILQLATTGAGDEQAETVDRSGGNDIYANTVNIYGDVIGRDKT
jgi:hypothetical protein